MTPQLESAPGFKMSTCFILFVASLFLSELVPPPYLPGGARPKLIGGGGGRSAKCTSRDAKPPSVLIAANDPGARSIVSPLHGHAVGRGKAVQVDIMLTPG